jgi:hypothetical protein
LTKEIIIHITCGEEALSLTSPNTDVLYRYQIGGTEIINFSDKIINEFSNSMAGICEIVEY